MDFLDSSQSLLDVFRRQNCSFGSEKWPSVQHRKLELTKIACLLFHVGLTGKEAILCIHTYRFHIIYYLKVYCMSWAYCLIKPESPKAGAMWSWFSLVFFKNLPSWSLLVFTVWSSLCLLVKKYKVGLLCSMHIFLGHWAETVSFGLHLWSIRVRVIWPLPPEERIKWSANDEIAFPIVFKKMP